MSRHDLLTKIALRYLIAEGEVVEEGDSDDAKSTGVNIEVANAVQEVLKDNRYKDKKSGRDIAFSTAYGRRHPKAVKDFGEEYIKQMEKMRGEKINKAPTPDDFSEGVGVGSKPDVGGARKKKKKKKKDNTSDQSDTKSDSDIKSLEEVFNEATDDLVDDFDKYVENFDSVDDSDSAGPENQIKKQIRDKVLTDTDIGMGADHIQSVRGQKSKDRARRGERKKQRKRFESLTKDQRKEMEGALRAGFDSESDPDKKLAIGDNIASLRAVMALQGDKNLSEGFLVNLVKGGGLSDEASDDAFDALTQNLNPSSPQTESFKREQRRSVMQSLSKDAWDKAVGGKEGPLGKLVGKLDPNYCPPSPDNGAKGGKVLEAGDTCPAPMSEEARDRLENFITTMAMDGFSHESGTDDKKKEDGSESEEKKDKKSALSDDAVKDYMQALIDGNAGRASKLEVQMRSAQMSSFESTSPAQKAYERRMREMHENWSDSSTLDEMDNVFDTEMDYGSGRSASFMRVATRFINNPFMRDRKYSGGQHMLSKRSTYDYQSRAENFSVGMRVFPFYLGNTHRAGIVRAVFPAIGMVDVQFPHGTSRYPVEDLVVDTSGDVNNLVIETDSIPGGAGTVPVSAGRVASRYVKTAIYWNGVGRKYRQRRDEERPCCPKCRGLELKPTSYKRRDGKSERLLACPSCLFLIKREDLV